jgi:Ser/Thr protein kinase RdoA (MazF antagonist)
MDREVIEERPGKRILREGERVIKVFDRQFQAADVLNEALNLACVNETTLNTPKLCSVTQRDGKWALEMERIDGETLAEKMKKEPAKLDAYLELFVDLQLEVQAYSAKRLTPLLHKMQRKLDEADLEAATRYELRTLLESFPRHHKLCHGDFNPSNIIVTADFKSYVIDWSHATRGNASADVARTYLLFSLAGEEALAEKYLTLFCAKSSTAREYVLKWLAIVAASQLVKGRPEQRQLLTRWTNVVHYE